MLNLSRYTLYIQAIFDVLAFVCGFFVAQLFKLWTENWFPYAIQAQSFEIYSSILLLSLIIYTLIYLFVLTKHDILTRNLKDTVISSVKTVGITMAAVVVYLFFTKTSALFSRIFLFSYIIFSLLFMIVFRMLMHSFLLPYFQHSKNAEQVVILGPRKNIEKTLKKIQASTDWRITICSAFVTDENEVESDTYIDGIPVLSGRDDLLMNMQKAAADSVLFTVDSIDHDILQLIRNCSALGKVVHLSLKEYDALQDMDRMVDEIGGCPVISYLPNISISKRLEFIKRLFDYLVSILVMPIFMMFYLITAVVDHFTSRGPVIVKYARVGKNGRRFYRKKFRVLRMDADERVKAGLSPYTTWGKFLIKTHLEGLPSIVNVLYGDMSMCGPYAPSLAEYLTYSLEQRKNLRIKPGIIGEWTSHSKKETIMKMEDCYAHDWSIFKDIKIYFMTAWRYATLQSRHHANLLDEEKTLIAQYISDHQPLQYDHGKYLHELTFSEKVYLMIKRLIDIVLSLTGIIVLSPVLLIVAIAVMADDFGSPIYQHERIGKDGKKIYIYKFRSMRVDAGDLKRLLTPEQLEQYKREFKIDNDPRITAVGNFIRKTSLDELPQLFNILGGSLSIVGPRPIVEAETKIYGDDIAKLLSVTPGLTGYWQAYARNNATYETGERQQMEMYYVDHHSLWLDIKIFFHTFISVIKKEGAK